MKLEAIKHISKSNMAYASDKDHLHIILQTGKDDVKSVELIIGDPFEWIYKDGKYIWSGESLSQKEMHKKYSTELFDYYFIRVKTSNLRSKYSFIINDGHNEYFYGCRDLALLTEENKRKYTANLFGYFNYPYINEGDLNDSPEWAQNTVWYQIFPDRFSRDDDQDVLSLEQEYFNTDNPNDYFFGGTLKGITNRIPYLVDLGITGIYFTPIFKSVSSHKYDISDYYEIDPAFGNKEDLKEMIEECHRNGIRVMLDAVFNHCGFDHPFFQDVIKNKQNSKYWDCFFIEDEDFIDFELDKNGYPIHRKLNLRPKYKTFAFTPMMPKWNTDNPVAQEYLLGVATYWIREFDIDGWRLDVSNEVSHRFWRKFKESVRSVKNDVFILGENWDDSTAWLRGDQFDAVMNYELAYPIWQFFGSDDSLIKLSAEEFKYRINSLLIAYPDFVTRNMFNMIGSHDTSRMLIKCAENIDLTNLAFVFLFSFSGSPALYYGDEISLGKNEDTDPRRPMIWDDRRNKTTYSFFKKLINIRHENIDMRSIDINWIATHNNILVYQKGDTVFILNNNKNEVVYDLPESLANKVFHDLFSDTKITLEKQITLSSYSYKILRN
ncbi:MAG: alpha-glycosidase [Bacilli bacterium]|nr:alpha-glycosidase [Bacilli bacterium]